MHFSKTTLTQNDSAVSEDKVKNNHTRINSKTHSNHILLCCTVHVRKHSFLPREEDVLRFHKGQEIIVHTFTKHADI